MHKVVGRLTSLESLVMLIFSLTVLMVKTDYLALSLPTIFIFIFVPDIIRKRKKERN